jgi:hypothetical protein
MFGWITLVWQSRAILIINIDSTLTLFLVMHNIHFLRLNVEMIYGACQNWHYSCYCDSIPLNFLWSIWYLKIIDFFVSVSLLFDKPDQHGTDFYAYGDESVSLFFEMYSVPSFSLRKDLIMI